MRLFLTTIAALAITVVIYGLAAWLRQRQP
jgi:hypothetical protein